MEKSTETCD